MISLEQVQLLEARVAKTIDYVQKISAQNEALVSERESLQAKLEANQKRIDELEVLIMRFKEDQGRIEDGIISALDRLSQFEEAFENSLKNTSSGSGSRSNAKKAAPKSKAEEASKEIFFEIPEKDGDDNDLSSEGELDIF